MDAAIVVVRGQDMLVSLQQQVRRLQWVGGPPVSLGMTVDVPRIWPVSTVPTARRKYFDEVLSVDTGLGSVSKASTGASILTPETTAQSNPCQAAAFCVEQQSGDQADQHCQCLSQYWIGHQSCDCTESIEIGRAHV